MVLNTRGPCSSRLLRNVRKGHQILSAPPDRIAHTPLGELTGPPAVFKNNLEVQKVKSVTAAEERLQQVRFQQHQKGQKGLYPTVVHLKDASFHNKNTNSSLNRFVQLNSAPWCVLVELLELG